jgi:lysophospholipase L1-like esterase
MRDPKRLIPTVMGGTTKPWYLTGGAIPNVAYRSIKAATLADSYKNFANPGTKDASDGVAPAWSTKAGWVFDGASSYLKTGCIPGAGHAMIMRFLNRDLVIAKYMGCNNGAGKYFAFGADSSPAKFSYYYGTNGKNGSNLAESGVIAIAGGRGYLNGIADADANGDWSGTSDKEIYLGAYNNNGALAFPQRIRITHFAEYNSLTPAQVLAITNAMNKDAGSLIYDGTLVCDGDSLTAGTGASPAQMAYPNQLIHLSVTDQHLYNYGVTGQTIVQMIADAAAQIDILISSGTNNLVCWGGVNDIAASVDSATVYSNIAAYCQARKAAGWTVTVCTITAAGTITGAKETVRQEVNASIVSNYESFADHLADLAANQYFDATDDTSNTTYYNADTVHLTNVGYGIVAGIIKAAMEI